MYTITIEVTKKQYDILTNKAKALGVDRDGGMTLRTGVYELILDADSKDQIYEVTNEIFTTKFIRSLIEKVA